MTEDAPKFEEIREAIESLITPTGEDRAILWVLNRQLGIAKTADELIEIFMPGKPVHCAIPSLRRHIEHDDWIAGSSGERIPASRILLPKTSYAVPIGALITTELLAAGLGPDVGNQAAFAKVEPLVALVLRDAALAVESIVGVLGELLLLEELLIAVKAEPTRFPVVVNAWRGFQRGERDFVLGRVGIEVKTTGSFTSSHIVHGLQQVEPRVFSDGGTESLFWFSVGITPVKQGGFSLPEIVERLISMLKSTPDPHAGESLAATFLAGLREYGPSQIGGYDHLRMRNWGSMKQRYSTTFSPRLYDMRDPAVRVVGRGEFVGTFVPPESVRYRVDLPDQLSAGNPTTDLGHAIPAILGLTGAADQTSSLNNT